MKLGSWSITRGFVQKFGTLKGGDAKDPIKALDYIAAAEGRCLFVLRDFHAFVNDPTVVRKLRDLAHDLRKTQKNVFILSAVTKIPPELEKDMSIVDWDLPNRPEINKVVVDLVSQLPQGCELGIAKDAEGREQARIGAFESQVAGLIAEALGYPEAYCELLYKAAQLHDIGKIGIHESILRKPGPLTTDEWKLMREHPRIGAGILSGSDLPVLQLAAEISLSHHEHFSGAGYPLGSAGIAIPLSGRIVGLADFFDALTMDRCYRKALPDDEVLAMIRERRGQQFDPRIVDAFMRIADQIVLARDSINEVEAICDLPDIHGDWWMAF